MSNYEKEIQKKVDHLLSNGIFAFEEICSKCEGVLPTKLWEYYKDNISEYYQFEFPQETFFPEPHPIDYDWRFSKQTIKYLANKCENDRKILCVGTPSVFRELLKSKKNAFLVDNNELVCNYFSKLENKRVFKLNLFSNAIPKLDFDIVITDPPWYPEHYHYWIKRIQESVHGNCEIITTLFPRLVRPKAKEERDYILKLFSQIGAVSKLRHNASYETPLFELETLIANGLPPIKNWRSGDLYSIKNIKNITLDFDTPEYYEKSDWYKIKIKSQIIAIKKNTSLVEGITAKSIYDDGSFILKSVSRRHKERDKINLWTSRNRCLQITGVAKVVKLLEHVSNENNFKGKLNSICKNKEEENALNLIISLIGY